MSDFVCQILYVRFCMSDFVCQILYVRFCMSDFVCQILYVRCCMSDFVCQILYVRFCISNFVFQILYFRFCISDFIFQILISSFVLQGLCFRFVLRLCVSDFVPLSHFGENFRVHYYHARERWNEKKLESEGEEGEIEREDTQHGLSLGSLPICSLPLPEQGVGPSRDRIEATGHLWHPPHSRPSRDLLW
jgi:hypothetical protein